MNDSLSVNKTRACIPSCFWRRSFLFSPVNTNVILTPISSTNILSRPTGPSELLTMLAMDAAAITAEAKRKLTSEREAKSSMHLKILGTSFDLSDLSQRDMLSFHSERRTFSSPHLQTMTEFFYPISITLHSL